MLRSICVGLVLGGLILASVGCASGQVTPAAVTATPLSAAAGEATYTVQRGHVARLLELDGRVAPVAETQLSFANPGYVKQVYVAARDQVRAGDILASLEVGNLPAEVAQAEIELDLAREALDEANNQRADAIAAAELGLAMAEARLKSAEDANEQAIAQAELAVELAQEQLAGLQALGPTYAAGVTSARVGLASAQERQGRAQQEYNEAKERPWEPADSIDAYARELQAANWAVQAAQAQVAQALAEQAAYGHDVEVQGVVVQQAEAEVTRLSAGVDPLLELEVQRAQLAVDQADREVGPALATRVTQAQVALDELRSQQDQAAIRSPIDGQVVSLSVYPGQLVQPLQPVIVVADPAVIEVRSAASTEEIRSLVEGQPVSLTLGTRSEQTYEGVIRCLPYPYGSCGASEGAASEPAVRVQVEADAGTLQVGLPAQVTVVLEAHDDVLWLPPEMIRTLQGRPFVIVQEGMRQRRVEVETGVEGQDRVEILSGLQEGQIVAAP
jgi:HlyD family secretion protein